ncbi:hypothetical protein ACHAW5_001010 [Stephanodiscus triporus]|uniref:Uncharacterized protein n=1 Tax=Stephanodiscus triporus TaxID=2934178 RepID=A0ABD3NVV8_9STRA
MDEDDERERGSRMEKDKRRHLRREGGGEGGSDLSLELLGDSHMRRTGIIHANSMTTHAQTSSSTTCGVEHREEGTKMTEEGREGEERQIRTTVASRS